MRIGMSMADEIELHVLDHGAAVRTSFDAALTEATTTAMVKTLHL
jgi:hypothetical protein